MGHLFISDSKLLLAVIRLPELCEHLGFYTLENENVQDSVLLADGNHSAGQSISSKCSETGGCGIGSVT